MDILFRSNGSEQSCRTTSAAVSRAPPTGPTACAAQGPSPALDKEYCTLGKIQIQPQWTVPCIYFMALEESNFPFPFSLMRASTL